MKQIARIVCMGILILFAAHGTSHAQTLSALIHVADSLQKVMDLDSAYALAGNLLERAEAEYGSSDTLVARVLDVLAKCCEERAEYVKAESLWRRALSIRRDRLGADHNDIAGILNNLAITMLKQGKFAESDSLQKRALEIRQNLI